MTVLWIDRVENERKELIDKLRAVEEERARLVPIRQSPEAEIRALVAHIAEACGAEAVSVLAELAEHARRRPEKLARLAEEARNGA